MRQLETSAALTNANVYRQVKRQISRGIDYRQYVFSYAARQGAAWFAFGFSVAVAATFVDDRITGYQYGAFERLLIAFIIGMIFGSPVFSFAAVFRRDQYDNWVQETVEMQNDSVQAVPAVKEKIRPYMPKDTEEKTKTIVVGKYAIDPEKMGEWADVIFSRKDKAVVRDDIPDGIFENVTSLWRRRDIQNELIRLGWGEWTNEKTGSIKLTPAGEKYFDQF